MSALSLLSMMSGGAMPALSIPCAPCLAGAVPEPAQAVTLVRATLVCAEHAGELLETFDRGHVAAGLADLGRAISDALAGLERPLDRLAP